MHRNSRILTALVTLALLATSAHAKEMTADEIIDKSYDRGVMEFKAATADMKMDMIDGSKVFETRQLKVKALEEKGLRKILLTFTKPADVSGTAFLSLENEGDKPDDQWLYMPALKMTLRKGGKSGKGDSFMGTEFTFGDLESKDVDEATHKRLADAKVDGVDCYVIESIPKNPKEETYGKYISYIGKKNFVPRQIKLYNLDGKFQKLMKSEKIETIDGDETITRAIMVNMLTKKSTRLYLTNINTKAKLTAADFSKERMTKL